MADTDVEKLVNLAGLKRQADLIKDWVLHSSGKLNIPTDGSDGNGKLLRSNGDGSATWTSINPIDFLPTLPTANGTYNLQAIIIDGTVTFNWVSA